MSSSVGAGDVRDAPAEHTTARTTPAAPDGEGGASAQAGTSPDGPRIQDPDAAQPARASGARLVWTGVIVMVVAALLPVAGSLLGTGLGTVLWLVSMPMCLAGAGAGAVGVQRQRHARAALADDWG